MIRKSEKSLKQKNVKITKRALAFKGCASSDNVKTLNYFDPELQLKDTESGIKSTLKNIVWIKRI